MQGDGCNTFKTCVTTYPTLSSIAKLAVLAWCFDISKGEIHQSLLKKL